jgi:hypothetical protein
VCRLDPGPLASANDWLSYYERFWTQSLDKLDALLRAEQQKQSQKKEPDK